jgi:thiol-disulfide isomerase/thioredoxin
LLAREVTREYGKRVTFAVEDFGASPLADRFGVDKYPALFVDDVLVARPEDFYAWGGAGKGKYIPWNDVENRRRFQRDVKRIIEVRLAGGAIAPSSTKGTKGSAPRPLPNLKLTDLDGKQFAFADLAGKPLLVEMWATWCPPCIETLSWLKHLDPAAANVVGIAVESERQNVDKVLAQYKPRGRFVMATPETLEAFGGLPAVPILFLADAKGQVVKVFYGAPPDLHEQIQKELAKLR